MINQALSHYKILEKLGEGGMGVVYKAHDTHLGRSVAIKVLPAEKVSDVERKRRFIQEAKAASALNHPNIITIYDVASENGADFIAMEFVQGKTLEQLIPRKGMRASEALRVATQICEALAAAHTAGIVHRDLKPGNVMVSEGGLVKLLDFGLAKLSEKSPSTALETTQTGYAGNRHATEKGIILGTVSYMSPEQAEGKPLDGRSDIFSFGAVLYEMLGGQRAFQGESHVSTLAAILGKEPKPLNDVVEGVPRDLEKLIRRCLRKDRERRWQTMADLKVALQELREELDSGALAPIQRAQRRRFSLGWAMVLMAMLGVGGLAWWWGKTSGGPQPSPTAIPVTSYPGSEMEPSFSPDGNQLAFSWNGESQDNFDIYIKLIGASTPLRLTSHPAEDRAPAWSPDGHSVACLRNLSAGKGAILIIPALGGPERRLAEVFGSPRYDSILTSMTSVAALAWSPDGKWLVTPDKSSPTEPYALFLLSVETGERRRLTVPPAESIGDGSPTFSADGRSLAFCRNRGVYQERLYLLSLSDELQPMGEPKQLSFDNRQISGLAWSVDGYELIFSSGTFGNYNLWRLSVSGSGTPQRVPFVQDGTSPAVSRDGKQLAYARLLYDSNFWRAALNGDGAKPGPPALFNSSTRNEVHPQYSPDGKRIAFASDRSGTREIWACSSDGSNGLQLTSFGGPHATQPRWSKDGERLAFPLSVEGQYDIYVINSSGGPPQRLTRHPSNDLAPSWSRDGKWVYFGSNRSGTYQLYKMPAAGGEALQLTRKGGYVALESPDGKTLYYAKDFADTSVWRVPMDGGEEIQVLASLSNYGNFAVVDEGIYFVPVDDGRPGSRIEFFTFATGKISPVFTTAKPAGFGLAVSPDKRWILYSQRDQQDSDLMLVKNFR